MVLPWMRYSQLSYRGNTLIYNIVVECRRLELLTFCMPCRHSSQLS